AMPSVLICAQMAPGASASSMPCSVASDNTASASVTMVMTIPARAAASAAVSATSAPRSARSRVEAAVRFQTVVGMPARNALFAIPWPIVPVPRTATVSSWGAMGIPLLRRDVGPSDRTPATHASRRPSTRLLQRVPRAPRVSGAASYKGRKPLSPRTPGSRTTVVFYAFFEQEVAALELPKPAQVVTRVAAIVVVGGLTLGVCLAALIPGARQIALAHHYSSTVRSLGELSEPTAVYDASDNRIGKLGVQDREPAELAEVPQILINAVIATEDKTFWKNPGIDVSGVSRAFVENLTEGKISQGGSTITQQLVKNRILGNKRDLQRKAKELILAYRLNDKYSKREILKQYLNTVYFGQGSYGVKAAARRFFLTVDPNLQQMADSAVTSGLAFAKPGFAGALVAMDPKTGYVKAMTDSRPFSQSKFNLATDGAGGQVGSSFKVTTLATVLANGYSR